MLQPNYEFMFLQSEGKSSKRTFNLLNDFMSIPSLNFHKNSEFKSDSQSVGRILRMKGDIW